MDVAEPTLALPYAMPALLALAVAAALSRKQTLGHPLGLVALAALQTSAAMFTAVWISHRYTGDFCPPLFEIAAFGVPALGLLRPRLRSGARALLLVLTGTSFLATLALVLG